MSISFFLEIINHYIRRKKLAQYKTNLRKIELMMALLENDLSNLADSSFSEIPQKLAKHIAKCSPTALNFTPPSSIGDYLTNSYINDPSEFFAYEDKNQTIDAQFIIKTFPTIIRIDSSTDCSMQGIRNYLERWGDVISLEDKSIEELSCGCYMAKHIFVVPSNNSLTTLLSQCIKEKAASLSYLYKLFSTTNNDIELVSKILEKIGLHERFKEKKITCTPIKKQKFSKLQVCTLNNLIHTSPDCYEKKIAPTTQSVEQDITTVYSQLQDEKGLWIFLASCLLDSSIIKKIFDTIDKEKEEKFECFAKNIKYFLYKFYNDNKNVSSWLSSVCFVESSNPLISYSEKIQILEDYLQCLKKFVLEPNPWEIKGEQKNTDRAFISEKESPIDTLYHSTDRVSAPNTTPPAETASPLIEDAIYKSIIDFEQFDRAERLEKRGEHDQANHHYNLAFGNAEHKKESRNNNNNTEPKTKDRCFIQ